MRLIPDYAWAVITILQEAEGEPYIGKVAVAEVIRRRTDKKIFSDGTVPGTVLQDRQFSGWNHGRAGNAHRIRCAKADTHDHVVADCLRAWSEAEAGSNYSKGATHYYNPRIVDPVWAEEMVETAVVGNHRFMRRKR